jgi:hypothetical protein
MCRDCRRNRRPRSRDLPPTARQVAVPSVSAHLSPWVQRL